MALDYSPENRELQDRFDTRRLADRLADVRVHQRFTADDRAFIEGRDMFFLATVDSDGQPTCSYKGGDPGFVTVLDEQRLAFPNFDGNGMFLSTGNVLSTSAVGMLFIDFEAQRRMRVDGSAALAFDHPLLEKYPQAQFLVLVTATRIFPNCPRYIHKQTLVERSSFVPRGHTPPPIPGWKQSEWASDVLPAGDPARRRGS
jgi:predicted pyridoxine 5'-phosphate oxidase superfamily flavin-nucleotide-binding protein